MPEALTVSALRAQLKTLPADLPVNLALRASAPTRFEIRVEAGHLLLVPCPDFSAAGLQVADLSWRFHQDLAGVPLDWPVLARGCGGGCWWSGWRVTASCGPRCRKRAGFGVPHTFDTLNAPHNPAS
ncbi:hypothetical protein [Deinococcus sp. JMULE3]|uniref:hypothetical protein n=1 Tax=Deinococcus sp. JMULE3 TaxID=2518341 RepID=UPI0015763B40|nr:hypothetical protein [Deinococcus sp. JMULE3]NTX99261.1 hypothetical protein [Deinococcus sp. JMULE3]